MAAANTLKRIVKRGLVRAGVWRAAGTVLPKSVAILRYHSVVEDPSAFSDTIGVGIVHSRSCFERQMEALARHYKPVPLDDVAAWLAGEGEIPRTAVVVTFDDGYADNFHIAAPIMERYGVQGAFYMTIDAVDDQSIPWFIRLRHAFSRTMKPLWEGTDARRHDLRDARARNEAFLAACGQVGRLPGTRQREKLEVIEAELGTEPFVPKEALMMRRNQLIELTRRGHVVGSHTLSHPNVAHVDHQDLVNELVESRQRLKQLLGQRVVHFSYPSPILEPHWTAATVQVTREAGYGTAVTCTAGAVRRGDDPLSLRRIWVPHDEVEFRWNLDCALAGRKL